MFAQSGLWADAVRSFGPARSEGGKIGVGKIFILPSEECCRIRTGETGSVAIGP
jgi:nitrogen regulatory protein PII